MVPILYGFPKVPTLITVPQKCQYWQKLGPVYKNGLPKSGTRHLAYLEKVEIQRIQNYVKYSIMAYVAVKRYKTCVTIMERRTRVTPF